MRGAHSAAMSSALQPLRHPGITAILSHFEYDHLPEPLALVSRPCSQLAHAMANDLPDDPEVTAGLRKLLEAKDCFVRAALARSGSAPVPPDRDLALGSAPVECNIAPDRVER